MPRMRMVAGELVEEPLHIETVRATSPSSAKLFPVALPDHGWSSDPGRNARKRRGINGAANALRAEICKANPDPGAQACVDRVSDAVATTERRDR